MNRYPEEKLYVRHLEEMLREVKTDVYRREVYFVLDTCGIIALYHHPSRRYTPLQEVARKEFAYIICGGVLQELHTQNRQKRRMDDGRILVPDDLIGKLYTTWKGGLIMFEQMPPEENRVRLIQDAFNSEPDNTKHNSRLATADIEQLSLAMDLIDTSVFMVTKDTDIALATKGLSKKGYNNITPIRPEYYLRVKKK